MPAPLTHGVRALEDRIARGGALDEATAAKVADLIAHYAEDHPAGLADMSNRELSILRDVALCDIVIGRSIQWALERGQIIDANGNLLPVLGKNFLAYVNSKRLGLVALGLRPEKAEAVPQLGEYLKAKAAQANAAAPTAASD